MKLPLEMEPLVDNITALSSYPASTGVAVKKLFRALMSHYHQ